MTAFCRAWAPCYDAVFYLHDRYEIQILGHRGNELPTDTEVGAIYHIKRPDKVAVRPDGTWQSFDILFHAPRFDSAGKNLAAGKA